MYTFVGWHCKYFEGKPALNVKCINRDNRNNKFFDIILQANNIALLKFANKK